MATLEAVSQAGGVPVVADIGETDLNLDPDAAGLQSPTGHGSCCPFIFTGN